MSDVEEEKKHVSANSQVEKGNFLVKAPNLELGEKSSRIN